jgi:exodeoxyribonuclease V beta subunit
VSPRFFDVEQVALGGTQLVEASAGTGKTYAISTLVVRLLLEREWTIDRILVVTFTEAATAELKDRVRRRIREALALVNRGAPADTDLARLVARVRPEVARERLERALTQFDRAAIFTIHGFCQRALQENAFASRVAFEVELVRDPRPLIEEIVLDFWAREVGPAPRVFVEHLRDAGVTPNNLQELARWVARTASFCITPESPSDGSTGRQFGRVDTSSLQSALSAARSAFDPPEVQRLIAGHDVNRSRYQAAHVAKWCRDAGDMLEDDRELPLLPDRFDKFSTRVLAEASRSKVAPEHPFFSAADELERQVAATKKALEDEELHFYLTLVETVRRDFKRRKRERGLLTFDDLLFDLQLALSSPLGAELQRGLRERFPVALIDEFQDTDPLQYDIFHRIYGDRTNPMFLIGDPKQAIYSFRGADVFAYLGAMATVDETHRFTMPHNHRSDPPLVEAVNALFSQAPHPFFLDELRYTAVKPRDNAPPAPHFPPELDLAPLQFRFLREPAKNDPSYRFDASLTERTVPDLVAREVSRLLAAGIRMGNRALSPRDVAILTRTNAEAFHCQRALQRVRVPSVVLGDRSVFQYPEAEELQLFLAAVLEPLNQRSIRAALSSELLGVKVSELQRMETDPTEWDVWADRFKTYHQRWVSDGFVQMVRGALEECAITRRLLELVDGERRMTNLLHLIELLHVEATTRHLGPSGLLHFLGEARARAAGAPEDSEQIRLESDEDTVTLTTVHKAKGLEYGVVLCPFPFKDVLLFNADRAPIHFHDPERKRALTLALGKETRERHIPEVLDEQLAENLRLLYVALTRAKHATIVYWCRARGYEESALGYLLHGKDARSLTGEPNREQVKGHLKSLGDDALLARLEEFAAAVPGISASEVRVGEAIPQYRPPSSTSPKLSQREVKAALTSWQRTSSFTELAHGSDRTTLGPNEGRDHDETLETLPGSEDDSERCRLADFQGGAQTGNFFHAVLERWDFSKKLPDGLVREQLLAHGLPLELEKVAGEALGDFVKTKLHTADGRFRLCDLEPKARKSELEFYLPAGPGSTFGERAGADGHRLSPRALAAAFQAHPSPELPTSYAAQLEELRFPALRGYLKGYIDLVFEHGGRWYVVDYKTNHLGDTYADYGALAMSRCMMQSHYFLQYHLYSVALHRLLAARKRDYLFERDFGGVYYLFLRGMRGDQRTGVFFEKPPARRIEALSELLSRGATS